MGHLSHFLADPAVWHKIDLVRVRDRKAPGGWHYYAHLLTHQPGYQSAAIRARRAQIPSGRRAGVDANVSNVALASFPVGNREQLHVEQITWRGWPPSKSGRAQSTSTSHQHHLILDRPGPAGTIWWPLLSK